MGRLFQYNRFGATTDNDNKKDTQLKNKMLRNAIKCPDYSDIYGQYNVDSAQEKCEQWTSKLQFPSAGEQEPNQSRTHKVYDSMKNFLQRKLFAQSSHKEQQVLDEEPTSDYDEQDLLDSSYHADAEEEEEERDADCSCSSTTSSSSNPTTPKRSPQKSLLSLNCWQTSQPSSDSNPEDDDEEVAEEDSDAGISDCCQLVTENSSLITSSKRRRIIRLPIRYGSTHHNSDDEDDEEPELLECPWYQPRITAKAAVEHLRKSTPGSFLLRRSTPRNFQLVVRLEKNSKVKAYPVQTTRNLMYRLKGAKKQFTSLKALITHHSVMQEQLPVILDMPRERHAVKNASIRYDDDFEPLESLQLLGILKSLQAKGIEM